jgi:hypothetical protein
MGVIATDGREFSANGCDKLEDFLAELNLRE